VPNYKTKALASAPYAFSDGKCALFGCKRLTMRAERKGLTDLYCSYHIQRIARHGHHTEGSLGVNEKRPYKEIAAKWIKTHQGTIKLKVLLNDIATLLAEAGTAYNATQLHGLTPTQKALAALARLREAKVSPEEILLRWMTVGLTLLATERWDRCGDVYHFIQIAKSVHRLASGYRIDGPSFSLGGVKVRNQFFATTRGRHLRHLGQMLNDVCKMKITDIALKDILEGPIT
jgi:hypothetical protein